MNAAIANHNTFLLRRKNAPKSNMEYGQTLKSVSCCKLETIIKKIKQ